MHSPSAFWNPINRVPQVLTGQPANRSTSQPATPSSMQRSGECGATSAKQPLASRRQRACDAFDECITESDFSEVFRAFSPVAAALGGREVALVRPESVRTARR